MFRQMYQYLWLLYFNWRLASTKEKLQKKINHFNDLSPFPIYDSDNIENMIIHLDYIIRITYLYSEDTEEMCFLEDEIIELKRQQSWASNRKNKLEARRQIVA